MLIGHLDWVDLAWPMMAAACATLGFVHLAVWLSQRRRHEHLMLAGAALSCTLTAAFEYAIMHSTTLEQAIRMQRLGHVPVFLMALFFAGFAHYHFGEVRRWLLVAVVVSRAVVVTLSLALPAGVNYERVVALHRVALPGGPVVSVIEGVPSAFNSLTLGSWLLLLVLITDAASTAWRRSPPATRLRTVRHAGAMIAFLLLAPVHGLLIHAGVVRIPYLITPIFGLLIIAMAAELTAGVVRASRLADELREQERALRESRRDRDLAIDSAELALWSLDPATGRIEASARFGALLGLPAAASFPLEAVLARLVDDDRARLREELGRAMGSAVALESELRVEAGAGHWRWLRLRARLDSPAPGTTPRLRGVCYDITERRLADERFRRIVESAPSAILIADENGRIVFANQRALVMFGYPAGEMDGLAVERLVPGTLRERHATLRANYQAQPEQRPMGVGRELVAERRDGAQFPVEIALAPLPSTDGDLVLAIVTDITERRQRELAAARQRSELTHLSRVAVLGELSASLAHELNQPLAAILSNAEAAQRYLARDAVDLGQVREIVADIVADDQRAGAVIRRLRAMLRKEELPHLVLDLNDLIRGVIQIMHSDLVNRGVDLRVDLQADLPQVSGDPVQLQQVMLNLLVNACDAMNSRPRPRTLTVRTRLDSREVRAEIVDRGTGIPDEHLDRIFEPFFTTKPAGTGLGLSVCRTIVASHHGRLWARNNSDRGATVTLALPVAPTPAS